MLHTKQLTSIVFLIFTICCFDANGQNPLGRNSGRPTPGQSTGNQNSQNEVFVPDTTILDYFTLSNKHKLYNFSDTLIDEKEKYLITRTFRNASLNLGNSGSAAQPIIYNATRDIYTDIGFHQYDVYKLKLDSLKFFKLNRPYNDLFFSPIGGSRSFVSKATFARTFDKEINITMDFDRINQVGFYESQETKATSFGLGIWQDRKEKRHAWYFTFLVNNFNETHNGGTPFDLNTDTLYSLPEFRLTRTGIPTFISETSPGQTRHQNFSYGVDNYVSTKSEKYKLHHRLRFENGYYRFGDELTNSASDSLVYLNYLALDRGLRSLYKFSRWTNQIDIGFDTRSFDIEFGLVYKNLRVDDTQTTNSYNDLAAFSRIGLAIKEVSKLDAKLQLGLGSNAGNIDLDVNLEVRPIKGLNISGDLKLLRYNPSLTNERFIVTESLIYDNDFQKVNEFAIGAKIQIKKIRLSAEIQSGIIDNPIHYDSMAMPLQLEGSTEYFKGIVTHKFFWKFIGLDNSAVYQSFTNNIYNLPKWHTITNGYLQFRFFKKRLLGRVGILLYHTEYDGHLKFMPVNGSFYPGENNTEYNPYSELYGTFQIDRFFVFLKMENYTDALFRKVQYQIGNYPQFDAKLRMGVRWQIFD